MVQSHLTVGVTPTFGPVSDGVMEYGVARLRDGHKGHIIESLAFRLYQKEAVVEKKPLTFANIEANKTTLYQVSGFSPLSTNLYSQHRRKGVYQELRSTCQRYRKTTLNRRFTKFFTGNRSPVPFPVNRSRGRPHTSHSMSELPIPPTVKPTLGAETRPVK